MSGRLWGVMSIGGRLVNVRVTMRLCAACRTAEYRTYHDDVFVSLTYLHGAPVMHRR